jgi:hypothetical protein
VKPSQFGHLREATRHRPRQRNRSLAGRPRHQSQSEELNSKRFWPCGNNASTWTSPVPPTPQEMQGLDERQAGRTAPRPMDDMQRLDQNPERRPKGRPRRSIAHPVVRSQRSQSRTRNTPGRLDGLRRSENAGYPRRKKSAGVRAMRSLPRRRRQPDGSTKYTRRPSESPFSSRRPRSVKPIGEPARSSQVAQEA